MITYSSNIGSCPTLPFKHLMMGDSNASFRMHVKGDVVMGDTKHAQKGHSKKAQSHNHACENMNEKKKMVITKSDEHYTNKYVVLKQ